MEKILFGDFNSASQPLLESATEQIADVTLAAYSDPEHAITRLKTFPGHYDLLLIGPQHFTPVQFVQRIRAVDTEISVTIVCPPRRLDRLQRALRYTPFVGQGVSGCSSESTESIQSAVSSSLALSRQRREYRTSIQKTREAAGANTEIFYQSNVVLDRLLQHAPMGVVLVDANRQMLASNRRSQDLLGRTESESLGLPIESFFPNQEQSRVAKLVDSALSAARRPDRITVSFERADGGCRILEATAAAVSRAVQSQSVMIIFEDVTEREEAKIALQQTNEALEMRVQLRTEELTRSNNDLEQFAYVVSHDLHEPLRAVAGFTSLLKSRYSDRLDDEGKEFLEITLGGAKRMQQMLRDLLEYSRVGRSDRSFQEVDMNEVYRRVVGNLAWAIDEAKANVSCTTLPTVTGDPTQLLQLLQNLIGNAIKFGGDEPPKVRVSVAESDGFWRFEIADNGIGMKPQYLERIFVVFQRLHTVDKFAGTGIGLAVCKRIIDRHQGEIGVESKLGEGSTFWFTLPCDAIPSE
ncbi:MAG: ATP-binding protein [bacterium]|nr:ATP-binding protein [bacterium]